MALTCNKSPKQWISSSPQPKNSMNMHLCSIAAPLKVLNHTAILLRIQQRGTFKILTISMKIWQRVLKRFKAPLAILTDWEFSSAKRIAHAMAIILSWYENGQIYGYRVRLTRARFIDLQILWGKDTLLFPTIWLALWEWLYIGR